MGYYREEKKVVTMRLSKEDDNLIKELARQDNLTKSAWIRRRFADEPLLTRQAYLFPWYLANSLSNFKASIQDSRASKKQKWLKKY